MSEVSEILKQINQELPSGTSLVAVSKFHPLESIIEAYDAGQRIFAESRPQELHAKIGRIRDIRRLCHDDSMFDGIRWHFIGHLQTNKLKMVLPHVELVHSVDSLRLLSAIDSWGRSNERVVDVLLEMHIAQEESKQGFDEDEIVQILAEVAPELEYVRIRGLMGMASFVDDEDQIRQEFSAISSLFGRIKASAPEYFDQLSIGMSGDYPIACEYGSTLVRIGTKIFGERIY